MENTLDFLQIMEGLVSNDSRIREKNLDLVKEILSSNFENVKIKKKNGEEYNLENDLEVIYSKIWRIFWNCDKAAYQKKMADKIANIFLDENNDSQNFNNEKFELWIKIFLTEFIRKWPQIDFHRMDKYIMLTQTTLNKFFEVNFQNQNYQQIINFFDLVSVCITSGNYNFSFMSVILKFISQFIGDVFNTEGEVEIKKKFLELYFMDFFEKILKIFINVKDQRENKSFQDFIFAKIYENFDDSNINKTYMINISEYKNAFTKRLFDFAKTKDEIPENKRRIIYKIYKKMKYNIEEEEKSMERSVNPVLSHIMNKNYTHRLKMSKVERMKRMIERKKNEKRIEKIQKEEEEKKKKEKEKEEKILKEEILEENKIVVDDEDDEGEEDDEDEEDEEYEEEEFEEEEDYNEDIEDNEDEDDSAYWDKILQNQNDSDDEYEEGEDDEVELDPRFICFLADCGDDLQDISEEDKKIVEAYRNCQKNTEILKVKKNKKLEKNNKNIQNIKNIKNNNKQTPQPVTPLKNKNNKSNPNSNNNSNNKNSNSKDNNLLSSEEKSNPTNTNNINSLSKRKNSVNSQTSGQNVGSSKKKKNVSFKFSNNQMNEYDRLKPIILNSKRGKIDQGKPTKGSLKKNKDKK